MARIIANDSGAEFVEISAVMSGKADIVSAVELAKQNNRLGLKTIVFVDEFTDSINLNRTHFCHTSRNGTIILIGATTENPSFEVITPLLSRFKSIGTRAT